MGTQLPSPKRGRSPILGPYLLWPNGCMEQDATWYGGKPQPRRPCISISPGDFVLDGGPSHLPTKRGGAPQFSAYVYCGQTTTWIKMPLGTEVASTQTTLCCMRTQLPLPIKRGHSPQFSAHFYCAQTAGCIKMPLGTEVGLSPGNFVVDGPLGIGR